jgi:glycosyltransferase involved in cell wall biosynthesis
LAGSYNQQSAGILKSIGDKYDCLDIQLIGKVKDEEILKLHQETWALLFPSITEEPLPYAVVEASLLGTIPIASKAGGVEEILSNPIGEKYLFDLKDLKSVMRVLNIVVNSDPYDIINDGIKLRVSALSKFRNEVLLGKFLKLFIG